MIFVCANLLCDNHYLNIIFLSICLSTTRLPISKTTYWRALGICLYNNSQFNVNIVFVFILPKHTPKNFANQYYIYFNVTFCYFISCYCYHLLLLAFVLDNFYLLSFAIDIFCYCYISLLVSFAIVTFLYWYNLLLRHLLLYLFPFVFFVINICCCWYLVVLISLAVGICCYRYLLLLCFLVLFFYVTLSFAIGIFGFCIFAIVIFYFGALLLITFLM